jgi:hypothetical protein
MARVRRCEPGSEHGPETVAGLHRVACVVLMLHRFAHVMAPASYVRNKR